MMKAILSIGLFCVLFVNAASQEVLTGLSGNPVLMKVQQDENIRQIHNTFKSSVIETTTPLQLPFFDDFKQQSVYPNPALWMDNYTYINKEFAVFPPTWGAATFDAVDQFGNIYTNANPLQFEADYLTSKPIRLDSIFEPEVRALTPADSVYLSFYYQPQGFGNDPQPQDSLVLEFGVYTGNYIFSRIDSITVPVDIFGPNIIVYPGDTLISPCDPNWGTRVLDTLYAGDFVTLPCDSVFIPQTAWKRVWASEGMTLEEFRNTPDSAYFRQVFIPIVDTAWFRNDFQFRFFNYASIANDNLQSWQSNCDFWSVDFVLLDKERSRLDTTHRVITFSGSAPSFLEQYQSMPFYQYSADPVSPLKIGLKMYISNLDNGNQTAEYNYTVYNDLGGVEFEWDGGSGDLLPYNVAGFTQIPLFAFPPVNGVFPPFGNRDSIYFDIIHTLQGDPIFGLQDTISFRQKFFNYYAYDDGSPEFGYGLTPAGAQLAYKFELSRRDTLRAVQMYFNKTFTGANNKFFILTVWNDLNGNPGDVIYPRPGSSQRQRPVFSDSLFQFHTYHLDTALPVQGTFYVGWQQLSSQNLNVGFDANNNASQNIFFNVTGAGWERSINKGALMIRPILGKKIKDDEPIPQIITKSVDLFVVKPNPSRDGIIRFDFRNYIKNSFDPKNVLPDDEVLQNMEVFVFNLMGQRVFAGRYEESIDLSNLNNGIYIVRIFDKLNNHSMSQKLWIAR